MASYYIPRCCFVRDDGAGGYEVAHRETSHRCGHTPSGGTGGFADGETPCDRIIGHGQTVQDAVNDAREYFGLSVEA